VSRYVLPAEDAVARTQTAGRTYVAPLRPVIIGPRAGLHRFSVESERASLGVYDKLSATGYDYPDKATGSVVDLDYVKLYASTADLNYFNKYVGSNGSAQPSSTYPNRVRAANYVFKTGNGTDRSADFYDRDVAVGDIVYVRGTSGDVYSVTTSVTGFVGEAVASTRGAATAEANNASTQSLSASVTQTSGTPFNDVAATADGSAYESTADGYINRTYTVTVTQSSTGGDATTGRLRVRSADGLDDADDVTPAAFASPTAIGSKGLTVTFSISGSQSSSSLYGIDEDDFVVGQQWVVTVSQAFTAPTATSAGTYTGTRDATYIISVTRGGLYAAATKPQITITTDNGSDQSGPTTVAAAATAYAVGNYGVTISFNGTRLRKGDVYYVEVTAAGEGALKTLVLQDDIPEEIRGVEVDIRLFARRTNLEIPSVRTFPSTTTNWTATADAITVEDAIQIIDSEFTDGDDSVPVALDSATLYVEYREWLEDGAGELVVLADPDEIEAAFGTVDPDNPIAYAASVALANTYGELIADATRPAADTTDRVFCVAIGGDPADTALWTTALETVEDNEEAYGIVPLSTDAAVLDLVRDHVIAQSDDASGFYRVAWFAATLNETVARVDPTTTSDGEVATATVAATPATSPTAYTTVTASSNAKFVTNNVAAGDTLRIDFGTDAFGEETYTKYTVASVTSETTLVLEDGPDAAIAVARRIEVWHANTKNQMVTQLGAAADVWGSDLVRLVWPDQVGFGGTTLAGYFGAVAAAALTGSVPSNQGVRNVGLAGIDTATRSSRFFTGAQLNDIGAAGLFVISQNTDGTVYVRTANTTDTTSVATREEMVVRNVHMVKKAIQSAWEPFVGSGNVLSNLQSVLEGALASLAAKLRVSVTQLGPAVADLSISSIVGVTGEPDKVSVTVNAVGLPVPLNQIQVVLPVTLA
jgi:hypothetical protein